jgi:hypothetical protein
VEKLVYVVWDRGDVASQRFGRAMRDVGEFACGARARGVTLSLVDEHVADALAVRLTHLDPPPAGIFTFWLDTCDDRAAIEERLAAVTGRLAGYLVVESVPLVNTTHVATVGERTPGINMVALIERPERMSYERWIAHWHGPHKTVALETQCTYAYVRNVVIRALTPDAPAWAGIVEEGFPADAVIDPMRWYKADGSPEVLHENMGRMIESVQAFLDIDRVESHPMSEYRLSRAP